MLISCLILEYVLNLAKVYENISPTNKTCVYSKLQTADFLKKTRTYDLNDYDLAGWLLLNWMSCFN